ncbi:MAG: HEPN domain-containing protein [Eubacterium sp.]|nr:HEPN domain-containing protein [Eubacterium sp.]
MDDKNNKDLARVRIDRAEELLNEAKSLLENGSYKSANNRAYYSFEKSIKAILALKGVENIMGGRVLEYEEKDIMNRGIEQGLDLGREDGIKGIVTLCKKMNGSEIDVVESVVSTYGVSEEDARVMIKKYW